MPHNVEWVIDQVKINEGFFPSSNESKMQIALELLLQLKQYIMAEMRHKIKN